ncbi:hypothetical protein WJX74_007006 [Apatococcus lobatus]|uniref:Chromo shadow domain-containing protein n=1 Tax=Apatococcus lobatus TaxID=904363 RepID=A0AAW1SAR5_9CHLO
MPLDKALEAFCEVAQREDHRLTYGTGALPADDWPGWKAAAHILRLSGDDAPLQARPARAAGTGRPSPGASSDSTPEADQHMKEDEEVVRVQPVAYIIEDRLIRRGRRTRTDYLVGFEGHPLEEAEWYKASELHTNRKGKELLDAWVHRKLEVAVNSVDPIPQPGGAAGQPFTQADEVLLGTQVDCDHGVLASQANGALQPSLTPSPRKQAGPAPPTSEIPPTISSAPAGIIANGPDLPRKSGAVDTQVLAASAYGQPITASGRLQSVQEASPAQPQQPGASAAADEQTFLQIIWDLIPGKRQIPKPQPAVAHQTSTSLQPVLNVPPSHGVNSQPFHPLSPGEPPESRSGDPSCGLDTSLQGPLSVPVSNKVPATTAAAGIPRRLDAARQNEALGPVANLPGGLQDGRSATHGGNMVAHPTSGLSTPGNFHTGPAHFPIGPVPIFRAGHHLPFPQKAFSSTGAIPQTSAQQAASLQQPQSLSALGPPIGRLSLPDSGSALWQFQRQPVTGSGSQRHSASLQTASVAAFPPSAIAHNKGAAPVQRRSIGTMPSGMDLGTMHGSQSFLELHRSQSLDPRLLMSQRAYPRSGLNSAGFPTSSPHPAMQPLGAAANENLGHPTALFPQYAVQSPMGGHAHHSGGSDPFATPQGPMHSIGPGFPSAHMLDVPSGTISMPGASVANEGCGLHNRHGLGQGRRIGSVETSPGLAWQAAPLSTYIQPPSTSLPPLGRVFPPQPFASRVSDEATSSPECRSLRLHCRSTDLPLNGGQTAQSPSGAGGTLLPSPGGCPPEKQEAARGSSRVIGAPTASRPPQAPALAGFDTAAGPGFRPAGDGQPVHLLQHWPVQTSQPHVMAPGPASPVSAHPDTMQATRDTSAAHADAGDAQQHEGFEAGPVGFTQDDDAEAVAWGMAQPSLAVRSPPQLRLQLAPPRPMPASDQQQMAAPSRPQPPLPPRDITAASTEGHAPWHEAPLRPDGSVQELPAQLVSNQQGLQQGPDEAKTRPQRQAAAATASCDAHGSPCGSPGPLNETHVLPLKSSCHAGPALQMHAHTPMGSSHRPPIADAESRSQQRQPYAPATANVSHPARGNQDLQPASATDPTSSVDMPPAGLAPSTRPEAADPPANAAPEWRVRRLPASMLRPLRNRTDDAAPASARQPLGGSGEAAAGTHDAIIGDSPIELVRITEAHPATSRPPPSRVLEFHPQDPGATPSSTPGRHQECSARRNLTAAESSPHGSSPGMPSSSRALPSPSHAAPVDPGRDIWSLIAETGAACLAQIDNVPRFRSPHPAKPTQEIPADGIAAQVSGKRRSGDLADGRQINKRLRVSPSPKDPAGPAHPQNPDIIPDSEDPQQQQPGASMQRPHTAGPACEQPAAGSRPAEAAFPDAHEPGEGPQSNGQDAEIDCLTRLKFKSTSRIKGRRDVAEAKPADSGGGSDRSQTTSVQEGCSSPELCRATRSGLRPLKWASAKIVGARKGGGDSGTLELHVQWKDGETTTHDSYVASRSLKKRAHCQLAMIEYYESRIRSSRK